MRSVIPICALLAVLLPLAAGTSPFDRTLFSAPFFLTSIRCRSVFFLSSLCSLASDRSICYPFLLFSFDLLLVLLFSAPAFRIEFNFESKGAGCFISPMLLSFSPFLFLCSPLIFIGLLLPSLASGIGCVPNPCQNGGTCQDNLLSYTCNCAPGFSGSNCQVNINECLPVNPCLHGGSCNDGVNAYTCSW